MYLYRCYGVGLASEFALPELQERRGDGRHAGDVIITRGTVRHGAAHGYHVEGSLLSGEPRAVLSYPEAGGFLVRDGRQITVDAVPNVDERILRLLLLGPVLATLLRQRGHLVLHGSAVRTQGRILGFLGGSQWGKSTTAAAMCSLGCSLFADDVLALDVNRMADVQAIPGFPHLKLWPDAAVALDLNPDALPLLHPNFKKRGYQRQHGFSHASAPLSHLYVLTEGETVRVEPLGRQEAMVELLRHSYGVRWLQKERPDLHLSQCAKVVTKTQVARLKSPRSLSLLKDLVRVVEQDVTQSRCAEEGAAVLVQA